MSKTATSPLEEDSVDDEELPENWQESPLLDLCELIRGVSYKKGEESHTSENGYVPLLRANNIDRELNFDNIYYIPESYVKPKQFLKLGDVLLAMSSGSKSVVGKASTVKQPFDGTFGAFCGVLRPSIQVDWKFFGYFFQTRYYRDRISKASAGVNINNLKREYFEAINFPLPPLPEQQRIVARLEALLSHVDAAGDRLNRVPAIMKRFRQSVLAAACSGKLTEEWREENPDIEPINISNNPARTKKVNEKFLENLQILKELDFPLLPDGWISSNGDTIFRSVTSGSRGWAQYYSDIGASFIRIGNLTRDSISLDLNNVQKVNPPDNAERNRISVQKYDILISITADIGSIGFVSNEIGEAYVNQHIALCRPIDQVYPEYIALFLLSEEGGKKQFFELQHGATKIGLGLDDIRAVYIPLPPPAEQHEIVRRVGLLFERADAIEREVAAAGRRCERLTQAVMVKAFSGRL